jgi:3-(3-hydroxy-phenyl)propionate hydroxylase
MRASDRGGRGTGRPVVVVGAGPTGVTAAVLLAREGVPTVVLDRRAGLHPQPRAVHLDDEVCRILGRAGVAQAFAGISRPALGLRLVDRDLRVLAEFARSGTSGVHGYPQANMFDQPDLEALLRARLRELPLVELREGVEVTGLRVPGDGAGSVGVHVADLGSGARTTIEADAVLGCDGAGSLVRRALGATMTDLGFAQRWLVVDVDTDADLGRWEGVHQVCDRHRAATFMRIGERRYRWEFQLRDGEDEDRYRTGADLLPLLAPWTGEVAPERLRLVRVAGYTFRAQVADRWRRGPVFLLGDAAHLTPPFIGQGLGAGLRDASDLAWKLAGVRSGALGAGALDSYQAEREPHVRTLVRTAIAIGAAMTGGGTAGELLRGWVLPRAHLVPGLRRLALDSASPRLRPGRLLGAPRRPPLRTPGVVGTLAPNAVLAGGGRLDDVLEGWALLTRVAPGPAARAELDRRGVPVLAVSDEEALGRWLRRARATAAVVRPDAVVSDAGRDPDALVARLRGAPRPDHA